MKVVLLYDYGMATQVISLSESLILNALVKAATPMEYAYTP